MKIVRSVIVQLNCKIGGIPWVLDSLPMMTEKQTMICGLDVYHQTKEGRKSVLGFVATLNS